MMIEPGVDYNDDDDVNGDSEYEDDNDGYYDDEDDIDVKTTKMWMKRTILAMMSIMLTLKINMKTKIKPVGIMMLTMIKPLRAPARSASALRTKPIRELYRETSNC